MNVVLLVIDSLRAGSLALDGDRPDLPHTPFLRALSRQTQCFRRAYATECWTVPSHTSLFTGLLPSAHRAHFQTMAYTQPAPTLAEVLAAAGVHTELITCNFVFDGTIPGVTRGFARTWRPLSNLPRLNSVYDTHLHVPLWVHHPKLAPAVIDDVVSTAELCGVMTGLGHGLGQGQGTMLEAGYRAQRPIALAEHFYYPHVADALPQFRQNLAAAVAGRHKLIVRREGVCLYDLAADPREERPVTVTLDDFGTLCRRDGLPAAAVAAALDHLRRWQGVAGRPAGGAALAA